MASNLAKAASSAFGSSTEIKFSLPPLPHGGQAVPLSDLLENRTVELRKTEQVDHASAILRTPCLHSQSSQMLRSHYPHLLVFPSLDLSLLQGFRLQWA